MNCLPPELEHDTFERALKAFAFATSLDDNRLVEVRRCPYCDADPYRWRFTAADSRLCFGRQRYVCRAYLLDSLKRHVIDVSSPSVERITLCEQSDTSLCEAARIAILRAESEPGCLYDIGCVFLTGNGAVCDARTKCPADTWCVGLEPIMWDDTYSDLLECSGGLFADISTVGGVSRLWG